MNSAESNLRKFCALKGIDILQERDVQHGKQFSLHFANERVYITLFPGNTLVQGPESNLKQIFKGWAGKTTPLNGGGYVDLPSGWREWNEEANWIQDYHQRKGVPKEEDLNHRYMITREVLFHDYMFRNASMRGIPFTKLEALIRAWFSRHCFMNHNVDQIVAEVKRLVEKGMYWDLTLDNIEFATAADILSQTFSGVCFNKYACINERCFCPQIEDDHFECVGDIVDALFPYYSNKVLSYTKGNLNKLLNRDYDLKWTSMEPATPIEQIMSDKLFDANLLTVPQYQAWDENHRYNIDFVIKTPQGLNIAIECDGLQYHAKASTYIHDRKRDRYLQANGFYVMRFSSVEIYNDIETVITEIDKSFWEIQKKRLDIRKPYRISYFGYGEE